MINIEIPKIDLEIKREEFKTIPSRSGVYILYGYNNETLYVGETKNLKTRVRSHLLGNSNIPRFYKYIKSASLFFEEEELNRRIYEMFIMNKGDFPLNVAKKMGYVPNCYYLKIVEDGKCNQKKNDEIGRAHV